MKLSVNTVNSFFVFLIYVTLGIQVLTIRGIVYSSVKVGYVIPIFYLGAILLLKGYRLRIKPDLFIVFMTFVLIHSIVFYAFSFIAGLKILRHSCVIIIMIVGFQLSDIPYKDLIKSLRLASLFLIALVTLKNLIHLSDILSFLRTPHGHPQIPVFHVGGVNLEATFLSINLSLFIGKRKQFYVLGLLTLLTSAVYASRVGLILTVLAIYFHVFAYSKSRNEKLIFSTFIIAPILIFVFYNFKTFTRVAYILERFSTIGKDAGSSDRLMLWEAGIKSLEENYLFGYGHGNAIEAIKKNLGSYTTGVDNIHNYYLQVALDVGLIGIILFLSSFLIFFISYRKSRNVLKYSMYLYLAGCLVQFSDVDPTICFLYALMSKSTNNNE